MSKKKDRENTSYRYCPICGGKTIIVHSIGKFKESHYIYCYRCHKDIRVEIEKGIKI